MGNGNGGTRFGTIAIVGKPNVGKSTLLNALIGERLAITSAKPQATRQPVIGLRTDGDTQLAFVDQPGLLEPRYLLHEAMRHAAVTGLQAADAILYLVPRNESDSQLLGEIVPEADLASTPLATVVTKADLGPPTGIDRLAPPVFVVSARSGSGLGQLLGWCRERARPGPFRSDPNEISNQPVRFFVSEFVRETAFDLLHEELPYALAAEVDEFREGTQPLYIRVTVFVERESQKRMVIGKHGKTIKALGQASRRKIESFLGEPVYLDLWVKVLPKWRSHSATLSRFGLPTPNGRA